MKKRLVFSIFALALVAFTSKAQDMTLLSKVFDSSYYYESKGVYSRAIDAIKKYYDPNSYEINVRLGWLSYEAGKHLESMEYYQKAILLEPYAIEPRLGFVNPASTIGNWNQVLEQYNKILEVDPMNSYVNYKVGLIYYYREQYDSALPYFEKIVNLYPFDYDGTIMYAWTSYKLGKLREARVLFQKALLIQPGDASATEGLGLIQ
jgi:tetratricopeptide (TPR) repeat protein